MKNHSFYTLLTALFVVVHVKKCFVDPAPVDKEIGEKHLNGGAPSSSDEIDEVKQLEELKHTFDVNGQREGHAETSEQGSTHTYVLKVDVKSDGTVVSRVSQKVDTKQEAEEAATPVTVVETEVQVPSQGIHRIVHSLTQQDIATVDRRSNADKYTSYAGVQYTPLDMAEYIYWTEDEKGVTLAIEEFLQEGLMTREEAITFLQDIKTSLEFLQTHYAQLQHDKDMQRQQAKEKTSPIQKTSGLDKARPNESTMNSVADTSSMTDLLTLAKKNAAAEEINAKAAGRAQQVLDEDYEELLERLREADLLYTEYSLEEVIYQLAKVMFSQALTRGSAEAQEALQKFTSFLEAEAEQGHISRNLEKKVLDVLTAALTDTLTEQAHLLNVGREGLLEGSAGFQLLHQLLMLNPATASGGSVSAGSQQKSASSKHQGLQSNQSTAAKGTENENMAKTVNSSMGKSSKAT